jgi:hypothetical protein
VSAVCETCVLDVEEIVVLGDDDAGIVGPEAVIAHVEGKYLVSDQVIYSSVRVFDSDGRFERVIGGAGEGPGEYGMIMDIEPDEQGRLWLLDGPFSRITILGAEADEFRMIKTLTVPGLRARRRGLAGIGGGRFLANADLLTPDGIGAWTHLLSEDGILWSLDDSPSVPKDGRAKRRHLHPSGSDEYWVVWGDDILRFERRSLVDGSLVDGFEPYREWFSENQELIPPDGADPDDHSANWISPAFVHDSQLRGNLMWIVGTYELESGPVQVLDVFDLGRQRLFYTEPLETPEGSYYSGFAAPDLLVLYEETSSGTRLRLSRVALRAGDR